MTSSKFPEFRLHVSNHGNIHVIVSSTACFTRRCAATREGSLTTDPRPTRMNSPPGTHAYADVQISPTRLDEEYPAPSLEKIRHLPSGSSNETFLAPLMHSERIWRCQLSSRPSLAPERIGIARQHRTGFAEYHPM